MLLLVSSSWSGPAGTPERGNNRSGDAMGKNRDPFRLVCRIAVGKEKKVQ